MSSNIKISKKRLAEIIREEYYNLLSEAPPNDEEPSDHVPLVCELVIE